MYVVDMRTMNMIVMMIDGDNISPSRIPQIMKIREGQGKIVMKRVYGDFTKKELKKWSSICCSYNIDAHQVWSKNRKQATDMRMISDGALIMSDKESISHLAIVSGDQDLSHLSRIAHLKNKHVIGISGTPLSTSEVFTKSCDSFYYTTSEDVLKDSIMTLLNQWSDYEKVNCGFLKEALVKQDSRFTHKTYGVKTFTQLLTKLNIPIEIGEDHKSYYVMT